MIYVLLHAWLTGLENCHCVTTRLFVQLLSLVMHKNNIMKIYPCLLSVYYVNLVYGYVHNCIYKLLHEFSSRRLVSKRTSFRSTPTSLNEIGIWILYCVCRFGVECL